MAKRAQTGKRGKLRKIRRRGLRPVLADKGAGEAEADAGLSLSEPPRRGGQRIGARFGLYWLLDSGSAAPRQVDLERFGPALDGVRRDRVLGKFFVERLAASVALWVASNSMARALYLTARPRPWVRVAVRWDFRATKGRHAPESAPTRLPL